jgi:hypothetical protein
MKYLTDLQTDAHAPEKLEALYQAAQRANQEREFAADLDVCYQAAPDNLLYAAWHYRLQATPRDTRSVNWKLAAPLAIMTGLIFAALTLPMSLLISGPPFVFLVWAPLGACAVIAFLTITANTPWKRALPSIIGLLLIAVYVTLVTRLVQNMPYQTLLVLHTPLLAWAGTGIAIMGTNTDARNRFAFLSKSVEVFVTGGVLTIVGGIFAGITFGLFDAIGVRIPAETQQFLVAGGGGLIVVFAVAIVYDPHLSPLEQKIEQGLGRLVPTMMRLLLPLTLAVLAVYLAIIPFNFLQPFNNREILMIYNVMLFAVMGLLLGVTPVRPEDLPEAYHGLFRAGILAAAILTIVVSLYAMSATVYRTALGGLTMNRMTVIGWNAINIVLLIGLVYQQFKHGAAAWIRSLHAVFSASAVAYTIWALIVVIATPWLFR